MIVHVNQLVHAQGDEMFLDDGDGMIIQVRVRGLVIEATSAIQTEVLDIEEGHYDDQPMDVGAACLELASRVPAGMHTIDGQFVVVYDTEPFVLVWKDADTGEGMTLQVEERENVTRYKEREV